MVEAIRGLTRPALSFMIAGLFIYLAVTGKFPIEATVAICSMVFIFWFQARQTDKIIEGLRKQIDKLLDELIKLKKEV